MCYSILTRVLIFTITFGQITSSCNFSIEDRSYSSAEIERFEKEGTLYEYIKYLVRKNKTQQKIIQENNRTTEILDFVCACAIIRYINHQEYLIVHRQTPTLDCFTTWRIYLEDNERPTAKKLRGADGVKGFLNKTERRECAIALCHGCTVCSQHLKDDLETVQVLSQFRNGSKKTIIEMLKEEQPRFLLTVETMRFLNMFITASGYLPFPYLTFTKGPKEYAVPTIRTSEDMKICVETFGLEKPRKQRGRRGR